MKEQTQLTGVRKYFGDDFLSIQNEIMEAQEAYFEPYGNCVIKGCAVAGQDIAAGICYIGGKIVRFAGASGVASFPVYLELDESISKTREYQTGGVKEVEREFKAVLNTVLPAGDYLTINSTGGKTFREAFQDANNRMVSDAEKATWNGKADGAHSHDSAYLGANATAVDSDKIDGKHYTDITAFVNNKFGAASTAGTLDWNDISNTKPGASPTLLYGDAANGPGTHVYFHPLNLEYGTKDGTGNITQLAIPYGGGANNSIYLRGRYNGTWTQWFKMPLLEVANVFSNTLTATDFIIA